MPDSWDQNEIKAAIQAYFKLLEIQEKGLSINKSAVYEKLAKRYSKRSAKAFEFKFQNISAVLYEEHYPYLIGLKQKLNYQKLLKNSVLQYLSKNEKTSLPPIKILLKRMKALSQKGDLPVIGSGAGRYGLSLEHYLGIPPNSSRQPDFMGIELKTQKGNKLQTLFSQTPDAFLDPENLHSFFKKYSYTNKGQRSLYTSFSKEPDSLGFSLQLQNESIVAVHQRKAVLKFHSDTIEKSLLNKFNETAFVNCSPKISKSKETVRFPMLTYCTKPAMEKFIELLQSGKVNLDFTMSEKKIN